jgi:hypothetical protein
VSDVSALSLALLRRVADFLNELPEDQVADLAEGRARLAYIPWGASEPAPSKAPRKAPAKRAPASKFDPAAVVVGLKDAHSRDEGRELLHPLTVTNLRSVATAAGMTGVAKTPKEELLEQVVGLTIGGRISYAAMHDL